MFDTFTGLPVHILVVHAVVVLVPLSLVMVLVMAVSRTWRQRLAIPLVVLLAAAFGAALVAWQSGPKLKARLNASGETAEAIARHQTRGNLVPWFVLAALVLVVIWLLVERAQGQIRLFSELPQARDDVPAERRSDDLDGDGETTFHEMVTVSRRRNLRLVTMALAIAGCLAATVVVVLAGDSGSRAAWEPIVENSAPR